MHTNNVITYVSGLFVTHVSGLYRERANMGCYRRALRSVVAERLASVSRLRPASHIELASAPDL
jgi:hypothetical protein